MRNRPGFSLLVLTLAGALAACDSSTVSPEADRPVTDNTGTDNPDSASAGSITIPDIARAPLTRIPENRFNGSYQNTASPERGSGDDGGSGSGGESLMVSAEGSADSVADSADRSSSPGISLPGPPPQNPHIEPGTLTAGDYDDQLNPHLYQDYASAYLQQRGQWLDVPRLDFNQRIRLRVSDAAGQPLANAKIDISTTDNQTIKTLYTNANGENSLFTNLDSISSDFTLRVTALDGSSVTRDIDLEEAKAAGVIDISLNVDDQSRVAATPVDIMFVIDTTGSMGDELSFLQTELSDIINAIPLQQSNVNIGLVFYRDYGDSYLVRSYEFTDDINTVQLNLNQERANGGGDYPEAMDQALDQAVAAQWRSDSRKVLFLLADAPPHGDRMRATWQAAEKARNMNIHIVPVAASGVAEDAEYIMRSMAALTGSRYLFLTDDSGYGLPHAEPDVDCYLVTSLRSAMIRAMNSLVTGERIEPSDNDIIRTVGDYNDGVCKPTEQAGVAVGFSIVLQGEIPVNGTFTEQQTKVISDQNTLNDALAVYGESPIEVDFPTSKVVLLDMGQKNTGGYAINVNSVTEYDDYAVVNAEFSSPGRGCITTQALTNPYVVLIVETLIDVRINMTNTITCD